MTISLQEKTKTKKQANKTKQSKTKNKTKQNKAKQNKTKTKQKQNRNKITNKNKNKKLISVTKKITFSDNFCNPFFFLASCIRTRVCFHISKLLPNQLKNKTYGLSNASEVAI